MHKKLKSMNVLLVLSLLLTEYALADFAKMNENVQFIRCFPEISGILSVFAKEDGGYLLGGTTKGKNNTNDGLILSVNSDGDIVDRWVICEDITGGHSYVEVEKINIIGGYVYFSTQEMYVDGTMNGLRKCVLARIERDGSINRFFTKVGGKTILQTENGFIIAGVIISEDKKTISAYAMEIDVNGNIRWKYEREPTKNNGMFKEQFVCAVHFSGGYVL